MTASVYSRALLKLSGRSLSGGENLGIDTSTLQYLASEVKIAMDAGVEMALVVGGGNFWNGQTYEKQGMDRATADYAGMLATLINALALQDAMERSEMPVRVQSAIPAPPVAEPYIRRRAMRHMEKERAVILAAGTGNPYMSTDTAAALRCLEINSNVLAIAKHNVDGVYDSDPNINSGARKFSRISYLDALQQHLGVLDSTALSLCMDNNLPIIVFDIFKQGSLAKILAGEDVGTKISDFPSNVPLLDSESVGYVT